MKISIAYITGRSEPRFQWFVDSLCAQTTPEQRANIQLVFVDGKLWWPRLQIPRTQPTMALAHHFYHDPKRRYDLEMVVNKRFDYLHLPPKPCTHQGPFRFTSRDFFCASNARNTAIIAAKHDYLVCVDDLTVLMPGWVDQVMHAATSGYVVCGAYRKVMNLRVLEPAPEWPKGLVGHADFPAGIDSRWSRGSDTGIVPWSGGGLYGCSFGVPMEAALAVDGFEPGCNGDGGEDTDYGMRLERYGAKIFYNRNMLTLESEEDHHTETPLPRQRKLVSRDRLPANYDSYHLRNEAEKYFSDHVLLNRLCNETGRITPLFPEGLRSIRQEFLATGMVPIPNGPDTDWRDGLALKDL